MTTDNQGSSSTTREEVTWTGPTKRWVPIAILVFATIAAFVLTWVLTTIFDHKQEAKVPFTKVVEIDENTYDPAVWGQNFPAQYEAHQATKEQPEEDRSYQTPTDIDPREYVAFSKIEKDPRLITMWQGYAFSKDYREPRGHEWMLIDQMGTDRMTDFDQPGACLNCHASMPEVYDALGDGDREAGFHEMNKMPYDEAAQHASGAVACIDCHDPDTMELRITRPAFIEGIKVLKESEGIEDFDPNEDATHLEMRSYVCAQCHVEYYFKGDEKTVTFPWNNGLTVYDAMDRYDEIGWTDFEHTDTKAPIIKAQHPDFETWAQGIHAENGVSCADCHMAYERDGASKITNHQIASPMRTNDTINATCLTCHHSSAEEMQERVDGIQEEWENAKNVSFQALDDLIADLTEAVESGDVDEETLNKARDFQRKAQWIIDYTVSENSKGFHAPAYSIAILNQSTDWSRKGQLTLQGVDVESYPGPQPRSLEQGSTNKDSVDAAD